MFGAARRGAALHKEGLLFQRLLKIDSRDLAREELGDEDCTLLQRQNWTGAWARVRAPVLVLYGEYDWFESADAAALIADTVNRRQSGSASFQLLPKIDHHFTRYATPRDAFRNQGGTTHADPAVDAILKWLAQIGMRTDR